LGNGIETDEVKNVINIAGYWTLGVGKGLLISAIPMIMLGLAVGFMERTVKKGKRMGD
tara:strand:- start:270 stop:443 length:174 start_codon:yes stop_codon:yes gene_type:complete